MNGAKIMSTYSLINNISSIESAIAKALTETINEEPNATAKLFDVLKPCHYRHLRKDNTIICSCFAVYQTIKECLQCSGERIEAMMSK
jgi:hypothetical protein